MTTANEALLAARIAKRKRPDYEKYSFFGDKDRRTEDYLRFEYGWKLRTCTACNGSGRYDHNGSPKCGCCDGTGKERYRAEKAWPSGVPLTLEGLCSDAQA